MSLLPGLAPDADRKAILTLALAKMRDVVDDFDTLSPAVRREVVAAAAAFLGDLRTLGVVDR